LKKLLALIIVVSFAGALYLLLGRSTEAKPETRYITVPVRKGTLRDEINCSGTVVPLVEVLVGSQVSGTIKELYADFESKVKKGELIALIDPDRFEAKVMQARADLEAAKATLVKARVTADNEMRNLRRDEGLAAKGSISEKDYDATKTRADEAQAQVGVEKARLSQMEAKLNEAELELSYTRIVAPVDGVVTTRSMDVGQTVTAGFQTPVLFKIAEDLTRMRVYTNVDEADVGRVRVGQSATFTVPAFPERVFTASVTQIRNDPKIEQNVVTYNVVLDVNNDELALRPGMTANVQVLISEAHDALIVPDQALRFTPTGSTMPRELGKLPALNPGQRRVWKLVARRTIRPATVQIGIAGTEGVQVLCQELRPGDQVVVEAVATTKKTNPSLRGLRFRF
jgi:HlyD family secretion protein